MGQGRFLHPGGLLGQNGPHQAPPSSRRTCPLAAPVPHYLLAHRRGGHLGEFWLSPDAPTTPIRQKARFKIRDAKCHLRPRSQERAKDTLKHPLLGKWTLPPTPCLPRKQRQSPQLCWVGLLRIRSYLSSTSAPKPSDPCLVCTSSNGHEWEIWLLQHLEGHCHGLTQD